MSGWSSEEEEFGGVSLEALSAQNALNTRKLLLDADANLYGEVDELPCDENDAMKQINPEEEEINEYGYRGFESFMREREPACPPCHIEWQAFPNLRITGRASVIHARQDISDLTTGDDGEEVYASHFDSESPVYSKEEQQDVATPELEGTKISTEQHECRSTPVESEAEMEVVTQLWNRLLRESFEIVAAKRKYLKEGEP